MKEGLIPNRLSGPCLVLTAAFSAAVLLGGCSRPVIWENSSLQTEQSRLTEKEEYMPETEEIRPETEPPEEETAQQQTEPVRNMTVYICGEVARPDVYVLPEGSRIYEAVAAAGGFTGEADREWSNLAQMMTDGQMLRIYSRTQTLQMREEGLTPAADHFGLTDACVSGSAAAGTAPAASGGGMLVNINTATREELMTLPGIGQSRAEDIISYRQQHGGFSDIGQIKQISGIKDAVFAKLKAYITV